MYVLTALLDTSESRGLAHEQQSIGPATHLVGCHPNAPEKDSSRLRRATQRSAAAPAASTSIGSA
jgi:hypothetical protein